MYILREVYSVEKNAKNSTICICSIFKSWKKNNVWIQGVKYMKEILPISVDLESQRHSFLETLDHDFKKRGKANFWCYRFFKFMKLFSKLKKITYFSSFLWNGNYNIFLLLCLIRATRAEYVYRNEGFYSTFLKFF